MTSVWMERIILWSFSVVCGQLHKKAADAISLMWMLELWNHTLEKAKRKVPFIPFRFEIKTKFRHCSGGKAQNGTGCLRIEQSNRGSCAHKDKIEDRAEDDPKSIQLTMGTATRAYCVSPSVSSNFPTSPSPNCPKNNDSILQMNEIEIRIFTHKLLGAIARMLERGKMRESVHKRNTSDSISKTSLKANNIKCALSKQLNTQKL